MVLCKKIAGGLDTRNIGGSEIEFYGSFSKLSKTLSIITNPTN